MLTERAIALQCQKSRSVVVRALYGLNLRFAAAMSEVQTQNALMNKTLRFHQMQVIPVEDCSFRQGLLPRRMHQASFESVAVVSDLRQ